MQRCRELGGESSGERKSPEDHLNLFALSGEGELGKGPVKSPWSASPFPCRPSSQQLKTGAAKTSFALFRFYSFVYWPNAVLFKLLCIGFDVTRGIFFLC